MGAFRTDPSITLRGIARPFDPIQAFSRIANLRRLQQAGQFNQFRLEEAQGERERQQTIAARRQAVGLELRAGGTNAEKLARIQQIDPFAALEFEDRFAKQEKDEVALLTTNLKNARGTAELIGQLSAPICAAEERENPASPEALQIMYSNALSQLPQEVSSKLPQQYEPGACRRAMLEAVTIKDQIDQVLKEAQLKQKQEQAEVVSADRAAARGVTERGQDIQLQIAQEAEAGRAAGREAKQTQIEAKQTQALKEKEVRVNASVSQLDRLAKTAQELKTHPGLSGAVGFQLGAAFIPGTAAADFAASLETLASQIAFRVLQTMREASKTGGALGQVSEVEIGLLRNNLAALGRSQSELQFKQSLDKIISFVEGAKTSLRSGLQQDAGGIGGALVITDEMVQRFSEQQGISLEEARSELEAQNK